MNLHPRLPAAARLSLLDLEAVSALLLQYTALLASFQYSTFAIPPVCHQQKATPTKRVNV